MDLRDPAFDTVHIPSSKGTKRFKITPDGRLVEWPWCSDCEERGAECHTCENSEYCHSMDKIECEKCEFTEMCEEDRRPGEESFIDRIDKFAQNPAKYLPTHLKNPPDIETDAPQPDPPRPTPAKWVIHEIDNGYIVHYEVDEVYHRRFFPNNESLSRFISRDTD